MTANSEIMTNGNLLQQMMHTWSTGGWVMIALAALGILIYTTAAHVLLSLRYRGIKNASDGDIRGWLGDPSAAPADMREMIRYVQDDVHSVREIEGRFREVEARTIPPIDRGVSALGVMVVAAPLFGLLGTVLGMLLTFKAISLGGASVSEIVARGISEALVATQTGLTIAIPGWMATFVAKRWRTELVAFLLRLESIALRHHRERLHGMTRVFTRKQFPATKTEAGATMGAVAKGESIPEPA